MTVHAISVGPVALDRDRAKAALLDQPAREARPQRIKIVRAMRRFAEQDERRIADRIEDLRDISFAIERFGGGTDQRNGGGKIIVRSHNGEGGTRNHTP